MNMQVKVEQVSVVAAMIRELLGDDIDEQTFLDTLDGETDAMDMIGHLIQARIEALEVEKAMKEIAALYTARARRYYVKAQHCSAGIGQLLDAMGERKVAHPMATVSRLKARMSLSIDDESEVPSQLCKLVPDKPAIKTRLEAGDFVPGASLKSGEPSVAVRVK